MSSFQIYNDQKVNTISASTELRIPYGDVTLPSGPPNPNVGSVIVRRQDDSLYYADGEQWLNPSTHNVIASSLYSDDGANIVNVSASGDPIAGDVLTATGPNAATWQPPVGSLGFGFFYGLTAGTGNGGSTDYAATIAVKTSAGTGRVPFPRNGPISAGISNVDGSSFGLPAIGIYEVTFRVHTTEPGQFQLELQGVDLPETVAVNMNGTSGGHPIIGNAIITTTVANSILAVINPAGNPAALTITPPSVSCTHANAQSISIKRLA